MPEWLVWTLIGAGVLGLLVLLMLLPGRGGLRDDRNTNYDVLDASSRRNSSGGNFTFGM
jgi:hypothetical protein